MRGDCSQVVLRLFIITNAVNRRAHLNGGVHVCVWGYTLNALTRRNPSCEILRLGTSFLLKNAICVFSRATAPKQAQTQTQTHTHAHKPHKQPANGRVGVLRRWLPYRGAGGPAWPRREVSGPAHAETERYAASLLSLSIK